MPPVPYHYNQFPPTQLDLQKLVPLIGPATLALGDFKGTLDGIPDQRVLLSPLTAQEAVLSSKIEGTHATLGEVLEYEAGGEPTDSEERRNDIQEISNYRLAIQHAADRLAEIPLCGRLLKEAHGILMQGVRGKNKSPGNYRSIQNAIGSPGGTIETAKFLPISPEKLEDGMSSWERFMHQEGQDPLIQLAIVHVEFEALHPFLDGNGRLGRMLIPLFLRARGMLGYPSFYLSEFLEAHRDEYCERLRAVSRDGDWTGWCAFFLKAMKVQAQENTRKARAIMDLYEKRKQWMVEQTRSQYAIHALDFFFRQPIFKSTHFWKMGKIPDQTARAILRKVRDKLLVELRPSSGRSPAIYAYRELMNIAEGRELF